MPPPLSSLVFVSTGRGGISENSEPERCRPPRWVKNAKLHNLRLNPQTRVEVSGKHRFAPAPAASPTIRDGFVLLVGGSSNWHPNGSWSQVGSFADGGPSASRSRPASSSAGPRSARAAGLAGRGRRLAGALARSSRPAGAPAAWSPRPSLPSGGRRGCASSGRRARMAPRTPQPWRPRTAPPPRPWPIF